MGASAILIILCHAPASIVLPKYISSILTRGGWGVDVFLYLSGLGLYFSLSKGCLNSNFSLKTWYSHRFKKLIIPYLLSYAPLCIIRGIIKNESIFSIIGDISTISFWTHHSGPWFVALIVPLYLLAPVLFSIFDKITSNRNKTLFLIIASFACLFFSAIDFEEADYRGFLYNVQFAVSRIPAFIFGMYSGSYVSKAYMVKFPVIWSLLFIGVSILLKYFVPNLCVSSLMEVPLMVLLCYIFSKECHTINKICGFMGKISLESYLFNGLLPFFIVNTSLIIGGVNIFYANYLPYFIVVLLGTILSYLVHKITLRLIPSSEFANSK